MESGMRVYVTGVAGFLGSQVATQLLDLGHSVYGCDNLLTGNSSNVPKGVEWTVEPIQEAVEKFRLRIDIVVHCAAIARSAWGNDLDLWEQNVKGTTAAVKLTYNSRARMIHASSSVVHVPDSSTYARTKELAERVALSSGATALRFSNIYGSGQSEEGQEPNVIASMRQWARNTGKVRVDGDGHQRRDFIHVTDAASAVIHAIRMDLPPIWLDVCSGEEISILEIANIFNLPIEWAPTRNDPDHILQDLEHAKYLLGWKPKVTLKDGLSEVCKL